MNKHIIIYRFVLIALLLTSVGVEAKRITLPPNRIDGRSVLTQSMFNIKADEYVVRHRYDLMGESITIPDGAKLVFKGSGSIAHGTLIGRKSSIKFILKKHCSMIFQYLDNGVWMIYIVDGLTLGKMRV